MAFPGLTFPNQNVSALDDRGFYKSFKIDGVLQGCDISFTNSAITVQAGWLIACGGLVQVDGATTINFDEIPTSGYGRVMLQIDTSQASTAEDFAQLSYLIDYSASIDGFTAPVQEDINLGTGTIYQLVLAIVQISGGNISSITRQLNYSSLFSLGGLGVHGVSNFGWDDTGQYYRAKIDGANFPNGIAFVLQDNLGSTQSGVLAYSDSVILIAPAGGEGISFRPYGPFSNIGLVRIDPSGQIIGGVKTTQDTRSGSTTIPAGGGWVTCVGKNGLDANGTYLVEAYGTYDPNTNTSQSLWVRLNTDNGNYHSEAKPIPYDSQWPISYHEIVTGVTSVNFQASTQSSSLSGTMLAGATLRIARLG